jgi:hypothetical protein
VTKILCERYEPLVTGRAQQRNKLEFRSKIAINLNSGFDSDQEYCDEAMEDRFREGFDNMRKGQKQFSPAAVEGKKAVVHNDLVKLESI